MLLTLFCTLGPFTLMNQWQPKITATEAGLIYCVEPIFASIMALFLPALLSVWAGLVYPNEQLTWHLLLGGGLITLANVLIQAQAGEDLNAARKSPAGAGLSMLLVDKPAQVGPAVLTPGFQPFPQQQRALGVGHPGPADEVFVHRLPVQAEQPGELGPASPRRFSSGSTCRTSWFHNGVAGPGRRVAPPGLRQAPRLRTEARAPGERISNRPGE